MATEQTSISECCRSGTLHAGTPKGSTQTIGGRQCYVSSTSKGSKAKTVVIITDIFGLYNNMMLVADTWAEAGYYVLLPDIFDGDQIPESALQSIAPNLRVQEKATLTDKIVGGATAAANLGPWIIKHREAVTKPIIDDFFKTVRADPETGKVISVGMCFGGRYSILAGHSDAPGKADVVVSLHPSFLSVPGDLEKLTTPTAVLVGDKDAMLPADKIPELEQELVKRLGESNVHVKVYKDCVHGFTVRGDDLIESEKKAKEDAHIEAMKFVERFM